MAMEIGTGSIFDSGAFALVNPVNLEGVSGAGLALEFKNRFPQNFTAYQGACLKKYIRPDLPWLFFCGHQESPAYIVNLATKRSWRDKSRMEDVVAGLRWLAGDIRTRAYPSIAIPALGCGLGGLPWEAVRAVLEKRFVPGVPDCRVIVYEPQETAA